MILTFSWGLALHLKSFHAGREHGVWSWWWYTGRPTSLNAALVWILFFFRFQTLPDAFLFRSSFVFCGARLTASYWTTILPLFSPFQFWRSLHCCGAAVSFFQKFFAKAQPWLLDLRLCIPVSNHGSLDWCCANFGLDDYVESCRPDASEDVSPNCLSVFFAILLVVFVMS